ncbi:AAA family ATPase [Rhodococcoides fascians]|uniref:AAA family ATPase n=1 Tax=Rhodococcoides fascians TaxID=1828 RepID=UPI00068B07B6|nr:AAA family ATPase [Rhodococcus fascians]
MSFPPTEEQLHIHDLFKTGQALKVRAGAGTGKTTTLLQLAEILEAENRIGLYIAFNKSIAVEAGKKFPRCVTASTAHSLAYRGIANTRHAPLLDKMRGNARIPFRVTQDRIGIKGLGVTGNDGEPRLLNPYKITRHVLRTIDKFCQTTAEEIGPEHVPVMPGLNAAHRKLIDAVLPYARLAWKDIVNPRGDAIVFGHGHYLKLWALEHPRIGYEGAALFLDEAQDTSGVLAGVIAEQTHLHRVYVGDSAQAIYRFTGAVNAMNNFGDAVEGRLTQSWRFGPEIADAANYMLGELGDDMQLTGNPGLDSIIDRSAGHYDAILCRTNGRALAHVMSAQRGGRKVHLMSDTKYAEQFCESAEKLMTGQQANLEDLAAFTSWEQVQEYAQDSPDAADWKVLVKLIDEHGATPLRAALGNVVSERDADVVIATAHKSKGREFGRVLLDDDLAEAVDDGDGKDPARLRDEQMLAYVAITRAQHVLNPGRLVPTADSSFTAGTPPVEAAPAEPTPIDIGKGEPVVLAANVEVRFTGTEYEQILATAKDRPVDEWIREAALFCVGTMTPVKSA